MLSVVGENARFGEERVSSCLSFFDFAEEVAQGFRTLDLEAVAVGEISSCE